MRKILTTFTFVALLPAGAAFADSDDCQSPRSQWQPREAAMQLAAQNGWSVGKLKIDDGCYKIEGRDSEGRKIKVKLDPATLQVVRMKYDGRDDDRGRAQVPAPTGTVTPPRNGLFGNGTPPQVQVN